MPEKTPMEGSNSGDINHTLSFAAPVSVAPVSIDSTTAATPGAARTRYKLLGEIGRGGMGAIVKGHDTDLGRDIAVKMILDSHIDRPDLLQRFVEEARITGQLQHPGIVPVYELGRLADQRFYFTMKLVQGQTLAQHLAARKDAAEDRPRLLKIFEQICQTLAYAHARGVIHRDLKPANVMVGAFGEVQVMDWGLAKILTGDAHDSSVTSAAPSVAPRDDDNSQTQPGSVMGTPAYMPPEQARGEVGRLDERSDVFGLGAILCEILTGQPAYQIKKETKVFAQAASGDTADAFARLNACGADSELLLLAKRCLATERDERPRNAGAVAEQLSAYLNSVEQRLKQAELAGVEASARADEERRRLEITLAAQKELQRALTRQVAERLDGELGRLEMVGRSMASMLENRQEWEELPLVAWMDAMLRHEERVFGLCLAFEPNQFRPNQQDFGLYQFRGGPHGETQTKHLLPPRYPYRELEWYKTARTIGRALWTEPFVDTDGGDIPMVCYTVPLQRLGSFIGVATLDLSVRYFARLGDWLKELDFGRGSYGFVISRSGIFISHPNAAFDFASLAAANAPPRIIMEMAADNPEFLALTQRMLSENVGTGMAIDPTTGRMATWLFARVQKAGWTFVAVIDNCDETRKV